MEIQIVTRDDNQQTPFKIDLIVWKFSWIKGIIQGVNGFKIDLIVWKLSNNCNPTVHKPCLK